MFFEKDNNMINLDNVLFIKYYKDDNISEIIFENDRIVIVDDIRAEIKAFIKHHSNMIYPKFKGTNNE